MEENTTENNSSEQSKYEAFGEALGDILPSMDEEEDSQQLEIAEDVEKETQSEETEGTEEESEVDGEKEKEKPKEPEGWQWKRLREKTKDVETREETAKQAHAEAIQLKEDLQQLVTDLVNDPVEGFRALAQRAGADPDVVFQKLIESNIQKGSEPEYLKEIKRLERKLEERDKQREEAQRQEAERRRIEAIEAANHEMIADSCKLAADIPNNEELSAKFKNLAVLDPHDIAGRTEYAIKWAQKNAQHATLNDILSLLDEQAGEQNAKLLERMGVTRDNETSRQKTRQAGSPKNGPSVIGNKNAAGSARGPVDLENLSKAERFRLAGSKLF